MDSTKNTKTAAQVAAQAAKPVNPGFEPKTYCPVGGVILADAPIEYNESRTVRKLKVRNTGDRPIQIGSHYHFFEVNRSSSSTARRHSDSISTFRPPQQSASSPAMRKRWRSWHMQASAG